MRKRGEWLGERERGGGRMRKRGEWEGGERGGGEIE